MRRFGLMVMLLLAGCGRDEPNVIAPPPPGPAALQLIASYSLSIPEPSGLAYSPSTKSLYMISDANANIYRIDTTGAVLATIPVDASDLEGITPSANEDTLYVVEETLSQVTTFLANGTKVSSFPINVWTNPSHRLEGITRGPDGSLYVLNEKEPMMLLNYVGTTERSRITLTHSIDVSDICYDASMNCFWIISHESHTVMKVAMNGALLGQWTDTVVQGEGIAVVGKKMYVVSDSDAMLFVFEKP